MKIKTTLLVMAILTSISSNALNYFWVGGSGSWSDYNNHWATTSGGNIFHSQVPQLTDNVYFDALSFTAATPTVTIDQAIVQCADMTWIGVLNAPTLLGASTDTMRIFGSLALAVGMNFNYNGQVSMEAITGKTITTSGTIINASLTFNGIGGSWTLQDALRVTNVIYLNNGNLNTNNKNVNSSAFYSNTVSTRYLYMGSSIFNLSNYNGVLWTINPTGMTLDAGTSTINGIGNGGSFTGGGFTYNDLFFTGIAVGNIYDNNTFHDVSFASEGVIFGSNTFHDVFFAGNATIYGNPMFGPNTFNNVTLAKNGTFWSSNIFNNLSFSPGYSYTLQAGQTQTVGNICAQGTGALPIRIQSSTAGVPAIISKASGTICWDYVHISDITAMGGATFNAGLVPTRSQNLGGNTGLLFTGGCTAVSCLPCTAPSITTNPISISVCAGTIANFSIIASGVNLTYQWQVNQGAGFINLSGIGSNLLGVQFVSAVMNGFQYRCLVSSGACTSISNAATLTVNPAPIITVNSATICSGQTATLTASGATSYFWPSGALPPIPPVPPVPPLPPAPPLPPPPIGGLTTNPIFVSPLITTTYTVTGTTNGCSNTAIATVTVYPMPTTISAGQDITVASNTPVQLGSAFIPAFSYSWSPTTGLSNANVSNPTLILQNSGSTPQTFTYILNATNGQCNKTDTVLITIYVQFTPDTIVNTVSFEKGVLWVTTTDPNVIPINSNSITTRNSNLNALLNSFNVISYSQKMPFANTTALRNIYELKCNCDEDVLMQQMNSNFSSYFTYLEKRNKPIPLYDPADNMWAATLNDPTNWLWHLKKIQADLAWNITKGNPNIKVAVVDDGVDPNHPDLIGKLTPSYDFYTGATFTPQSHGTSVTTILGGETVDQGQIPNGQIASIGYNTKMMFASYGGGTAACLYASTVLKAKVISISWYNGCSAVSLNDLMIEKEILDNGTSIIKAAGNGPNYCNGGRLYPFSGLEDPRTIVVTSSDKNDYHQNITPGGVTNSHYPEVDVCAPGYSIMGGTTTAGSSWPYYGSWGGTSQSTPIVSGLAALMLSVNQCLESQDIQYILKQTADPITDAGSYPGLVGAGRINAFRAVQMAQNYGTVTPILGTTTWTTDHFIKGILTVESGGKLTIKSTARFSQGSKIIVKRGGQLIIDGGTLTNSKGCDGSMWQGIELWGHRNKSQLPTGGIQNQGRIILKNGATIENATIGIYTYRLNTLGNPDWNFTGGIIQASNAAFRNCSKDIDYISYRNFNPNSPTVTMNNLGIFSNCIFETTKQLNDPNTNLQTHVTLYDIQGVRFLGNEFKNTAPAGANNGIIGSGIGSLDASYTVADLCLSTIFPCTNVKRNIFTNLDYGIYANNSNPLINVKINHAVFINNKYDGVHLKGMNYPSVNNCNFDIGNINSQFSSGLYLDNCKYYSVQNNQFSASPNNVGTVGIWVNDSKLGAHEIYNNKFIGLTAGIVPLNNNSGMTNLTDGLTMHCNEFISNSYDIGITGNAQNNSIAYVQGTPNTGISTDLVRNRYSAMCGNENQFFIYGSTKHIIHASNFNANTKPLPQPSCSDVLVNVALTNIPWQQSDCPDKLLLNKGQLSAKMALLANTAVTLKNNYTSLVDGGNTLQLLNAVNSSMPAGNLKNTLMSKSPYLSDQVLVSYLTKPVTAPPGHIKDVVIANSPVTTTVKSKVDALNLPNGIKQQISAAQVGVSPRLTLEAQIIQTEFDGQLYTSDKINYFLNDTLETNAIDSVINMLMVEPRPYSSQELIQAYIAKEDYVKAQQIIDSLENINPLNDFCEFQKLIIQINQAPEKAYSMQTNAALKASIDAFANDCSKEGCSYAQALLRQVFNYQYPELRMLPENLSNRSMQLNDSTEQSIGSKNGLTIYPNPANDGINIVFQNEETVNGIVEIRDVLGKLIDRIPLIASTPYYYSTQFLEPAIYFISLYVDTKFIENKKIVLIK